MGYELVVEKRTKGMEEIDEFTCNVWGMMAVRQCMSNYSMLVLDYPQPSFPQGEQRTEEALEASRRWRPEGRPGIPAHKLGSNDRWFVSPAECREALSSYLAAKKASGDHDLFVEFIRFLEHAAKQGGFRVW